MNAHALGILEFPRVLALVAGHAVSSLGAARVRALQPVTDREWLEREHQRVGAVRGLVQSDLGFSPDGVPDISAALRKLRVEGTSLSGAELLGALRLLRGSRRTRESLYQPKRPVVLVAVLQPIAGRLVSLQHEEDAITVVLDDDGQVKDEASPLLRRVRRELRGAQGELVKLLEKVMGRLASHQQVPDMSVTVRNGRYVIPVRREARGEVGGIVHDTSQSGGTLFVEPPAAVEFMNRIRELEADEQREVERVLRELTDRLRPLREPLTDALDALAELDSLYARARWAIALECEPAELVTPEHGFHIRNGRHPLLLAQGAPVVPFDLEMLPGERTLLVSGPNTGGKTVLLKALGLCSALAQAGIPAPVGPESRIAVFDDVFADVGDEQSIQASLSTFSAHLKNQGEILLHATHDSLVLVDELGSGTDPLEGAALGGAILEELTRRGTTTVATTHLGALKELATEVPGVVNASLQFDAVELAPTYRLVKGIPGRSYGLSIARRLQLPSHVLARAEERVPKAERDVDRLLAELEQRETQLTEREADATHALENARARTERLAEREQQLREREKEVERRSRQEARQYLLEARQEVERTIRSLKDAGAEAVEQVARDARRHVEELAARQGAALGRLDRTDRPAAAGSRTGSRAAAAPCVGDVVEVETLGGKVGRLLDIRDDSGVVAVGVMKLTVPLAALRRASSQAAPAEPVAIRGDLPEEEAASEIDLRGMRVHDMEDMVLQALDGAVRADLKSLRIIHGKGTGALRERVGEMLKRDRRVKSHRLGAWNEGGAGVTVVELA
ncbi:MAG TPA: endonuclease MutS2 [Gemmatimonadaceae bacterium]|nr:endonuclease MutS2 [Gemmatimonadaceae bacterium]